MSLASNLIHIIPLPTRTFLRKLGVHKIAGIFLSKSDGEIIFQKYWVQVFKNNKKKVLAYWEKYQNLNEIKHIGHISPNTNILDIGCGISTVLHYLEGRKYGIDPLADDYKRLYQYPKDIHIQKGLGEAISFPNEYFDVVFCTNVLDHVNEPKKVIKETARVLKPSGYFVLILDIFAANTRRDNTHPYSFTKKDVLSLIQSDFTVVFKKDMNYASGGEIRYVLGQDVIAPNEKGLLLVLQK